MAGQEAVTGAAAAGHVEFHGAPHDPLLHVTVADPAGLNDDRDTDWPDEAEPEEPEQVPPAPYQKCVPEGQVTAAGAALHDPEAVPHPPLKQVTEAVPVVGAVVSDNVTL